MTTALIEPDEAATRLSITREALRDLVHTGKLSAVKINKRVWRFKSSEIDRFIKQASK